jgi:hypothetical protein
LESKLIEGGIYREIRGEISRDAVAKKNKKHQLGGL